MSAHLSHSGATRAFGAVLATAIVAVVPAGALARNGIYGGSTRAGDPIVITTDAKGQKVTAAAFRIRVNGDNDWWPIAGRANVRPAKAGDPLSIPTDVLSASRNAKGRFDAALLTALSSSPDRVVLAGIKLAGSLTSSKAKGTISGWVTVTDPTTMDLVGYYESAKIKWTAERSPGRVYGGTLSGGHPVVIKLDRRATKVAELRFSCYTEQSTPPEMYWSSSEAMTNFSLSRGHFGDTWSYPERESDGTSTTYQWTVDGRVTAQSAKGTIAMTVNGTQPSGEAFEFELPATKFTAATG